MWVPNPPAASAAQRRYNRPAVLSRIRRSLALKLILASAIPSAVVLVTGLGALVAHSHRLAARDPALAFDELRTGAILGTLLALTFAGMTIALAARLEAHVGEMELLLEVSKAVSGTLDLPEQLETLGHHVCTRFGITEFSVMLVDEVTHQLVIEAVAGTAPRNARGMRFHLGEGVS